MCNIFSYNIFTKKYSKQERRLFTEQKKKCEQEINNKIGLVGSCPGKDPQLENTPTKAGVAAWSGFNPQSR